MRRNTALLALVLLALLASAPASGTRAQQTERPALSESCKALGTSEKVKVIAKRIVASQVDEETNNCYRDLADEAKAQVFEAMAEERGVLKELRQETLANKVLLEQENVHQEPETDNNEPVTSERLASGQTWSQIIERTFFGSVGKTLRSVGTYYQAPLCDGDPSDVDWSFRVDFPYPQTNPNSVRSFSYSASVDAMLVYYWYNYGGMSGSGFTGNGYVYLCVGDNGAANAGGAAYVAQQLKLHDNN